MSQKNVNTLLYQHVLLVSAGELRKAFAHCLAQRREQVFTESREWLTCALEILEVFVTMCTHLFFSSNVSICIIYNVHVLFFLPLPNFHPITQSVSYSLTYLLIHSLTHSLNIPLSLSPPPPPPPPPHFSSLPFLPVSYHLSLPPSFLTSRFIHPPQQRYISEKTPKLGTSPNHVVQCQLLIFVLDHLILLFQTSGASGALMASVLLK